MIFTPRQKRALDLLTKSAVSREILDREVGCSNSPELISSLRKMGFSLPCRMMPGLDRDGRKIKYGVYYSLPPDRQLFAEMEGRA